MYGSFSEMMTVSQIYGPTLTIYRYFIEIIQTLRISMLRTYIILTNMYFDFLFD